jgi:hypothetical protein
MITLQNQNPQFSLLAPVQNSDPIRVNSRPFVVSSAPFRLRQDLGFWVLSRGNDQAILKHEIGLSYIAYLMAHPNEPIHALDLATRIISTNGNNNCGGLTEIEDPATGRRVPVLSHSRIQERGLALDDACAMRAALRKQAQLEAYVEDEDNTDPEKAEAYNDLLALYEFEKKKGPRVRDAAAKASDAVGKAIKRLHARLAKAANANGSSNQTLRLFADHIRQHILVPSGRTGNHGGFRMGCGGFFVCKKTQ